MNVLLNKTLNKQNKNIRGVFPNIFPEPFFSICIIAWEILN